MSIDYPKFVRTTQHTNWGVQWANQDLLLAAALDITYNAAVMETEHELVLLSGEHFKNTFKLLN